MAGPVTLAVLRTRIRQRSNNEHTGSEFVTDAELTQLVNTSYAELYGHLVRAGIQFAETTYTISTDGRLGTYDLPADFYATLNVYKVEAGGSSTRLSRHDIRFRPDDRTGTPSTYRVVGDQLQFGAYPPAGQTYELHYVPVPGTLTADADTVDGVLGWEEYLVVDCAIKVLQKEEADVSVLLRERERILARIQDEAANAEMTESWVIACNSSASPGYEGEFEYRGYRGTLDVPYRIRW